MLMKILAKLRLDARRGLILPDNFIDWFVPACFAGRGELQRQAYNLVYATVPPYTSGLVAAYLSHFGRLPLVLNIRDPWLDRTAPGQQHRTRIHRKLDYLLERHVVNTARKLTFIYQIGLDQYRRRYPGRSDDMTIIRPAFDFARVNGKRAGELPGKVTLAYAGHIYQPYSAMKTFARLLAGCRRQGLDFTLGLWGCDDIPMARKIISDEGLTDRVTWGGMRSLKEIHSIQQAVSANVILLDFKTVPTKLYELLAAGRKILYIGPKVEDQEAVLERYSSYYLCLNSNGSSPTQTDVDRLVQFLNSPEDATQIDQKQNLVRRELSARAQTERLAAIFDNVAHSLPV
jgi:hypothetical protein